MRSLLTVCAIRTKPTTGDRQGRHPEKTELSERASIMHRNRGRKGRGYLIVLERARPPAPGDWLEVPRRDCK